MWKLLKMDFIPKGIYLKRMKFIISFLETPISFQKKGKKVLAVDLDLKANLTTCFGAEGMDVDVEDLILAQIEDEELPEREERIYLGKEWCGFYPVNHWTVCGGSEAETGDGDREDASGNPGVA